MVKELLEKSDTAASMCYVGNPNLKSYTQSVVRKRIETNRINLMLNLKNCTISLSSYMLSFGTSIDCKETDIMVEDIEDELNKDEAFEKASEPIEVTPGCHSKVSQKKYQNVTGQLQHIDQPVLEEAEIPNHPPETPRTRKSKRKLSLEL